ncbi:hypothetical protein N7540_004691 [Penicillium herquei]|nr:hypothetical protein N7540_004691 [Penicillium herquei]
MSSREIEEFNLGSSTDIVLIVSESQNKESSTPHRKRALFRLNKSCLIKNSKFFKTLLPVDDEDARWFDVERQKGLFKALMSKKWKETVEEYSEIEEHIITLYGDHVKSMRIWFSVFHNEEVNPADVSIKEIWHTVRASDKYGIDREKLQPWFQKWIRWFQENRSVSWKQLDVKRQLLFPCSFFNNAVTFQILTKDLVYGSDEQIFEECPINDFRLCLRPLVIQQMNAARGRLRTMLQRTLFNGIMRILNTSSCSCKERTVFDFLKELNSIDVCPFTNVLYRTSVSEILRRLKDFDGAHIRSPNRDCDRFQGICGKRRSEVAGYFDGMCLDCMGQNPDPRSDYWRMRGRSGTSGSFDRNCRIHHGEPSWYFSFMGKRERSQFSEI